MCSQHLSIDNQFDLAAACEMLKETFGIDDRASFPPVFNREDNGNNKPTPLTLVEAKTYDSGAVLTHYKTK